MRIKDAALEPKRPESKTEHDPFRLAIRDPRSALLVPLTALLVLVALGLRVPTLGRPLWVDELVTAWVVSAGTWSEVASRAVRATTNSPLFFLVERAFVQVLGKSDAVLRLPSLLAGLAAIAVAFRLAQRWAAGRRFALLVAAVVALAPAYVRFSTDARPYAASLLVALLAAGSFWRLHFDGRAGALVPLILWSSLLLYLHLVNGLVVGYVGLCLLARCRTDWRRLWQPAVFGLAVGLLSLPALRQAQTLVGRAGSLIAFRDNPPTFSTFLKVLSLETPPSLLLWLFLGMLAVGATIAPMTIEASDDPPATPGRVRAMWLVLAGWFLVPALVLFVLARKPHPTNLYNYRYLVGATIGGSFGMAWLPSRLRPRRVADVLALGLLGIMAAGSLERTTLADLRQTGPDCGWRGVARLLKTHAGPDDLVLFQPWLTETADPRYFDDPTLRSYLCSALGPWYLTRPAPQVLPIPWNPQEWSQDRRNGIAAAAARRRVWLVLTSETNPPSSAALRAITRAVHAQADPIGQFQDICAITVYRLVPSRGGKGSKA